MPIIVLLIIAIVVGYFLGRSKYSKSIDNTYNSTKDSVSNKWQGWFGGKDKEPSEETASGGAEEEPTEETDTEEAEKEEESEEGK